MNDHEKTPAAWWGDYSFSVNQISSLEIGPLSIFIHRLEKEWDVFIKRIEDDVKTDS